MVLLLLEFREQRRGWLQALCLGLLLVDFGLTLSLRGNYFIDNFGGFFAGLYFWKLCHWKLAYFVDSKLFGLRLGDRFPRIAKECENPVRRCGAAINGGE